MNPKKAASDDLLGRFREIVSDPLNALIHRHPLAGTVEDGLVVLHNGLRVPMTGPGAYYGDFSDILVINRGVHEPLEEYVFQQLLGRLPVAPAMLELGAYWAHYSMWLKQKRPEAALYMVEPVLENLDAGRSNFQRNGFSGDFIQALVGRGQFEVDAFLSSRSLQHLDILHADIQGYEVEMLEGCVDSLRAHRIDSIFVSTHSQQLHQAVLDTLSDHRYRIEVSADFDHGTTSFDGFVYASSPRRQPLFSKFTALSREEIVHCTPAEVASFLQEAVTKGHE